MQNKYAHLAVRVLSSCKAKLKYQNSSNPKLLQSKIKWKPSVLDPVCWTLNPKPGAMNSVKRLLGTSTPGRRHVDLQRNSSEKAALHLLLTGSREKTLANLRLQISDSRGPMRDHDGAVAASELLQGVQIPPPSQRRSRGHLELENREP